MGEMSEELKCTSMFTPISRTVKQMGQEIPVMFEGNKASLNVMNQKWKFYLMVHIWLMGLEQIF